MPQREANNFAGWKGLCLIGMSFNHLLLWPFPGLSPALRLTYQSVGWFTFASVFFAIAGIQWGRRAQSNTKLILWNIKRAKKLGLWIVLATSLFLVGIKLGLITPAPWQISIAWQQPQTLLYALLGLRLPWLIDVIWLHMWLGVFATLLWISPGIRGRWWAIACVSFALWCLGQSNDPLGLGTNADAPSWHHWTSWQLLFVVSALSQQDEVRKKLAVLNFPEHRKYILAAAILFFILKHIQVQSNQEQLSAAQRFSPLFAVNTAVLLLAAKPYQSIRFPAFVSTVGHQSLAAYSAQCMVVYILGTHSKWFPPSPIAAFLLVILFSTFIASSAHLFEKRSKA